MSPPSGFRRGNEDQGCREVWWFGKVGRVWWVGRVWKFFPDSPDFPDAPDLFSEALVDLRPVHDVPPGVDVVGPAVLILQIVGVLPHVEAEHDFLAFHQRAVLVGAALDGELAALIDHPRPAAAEAA